MAESDHELMRRLQSGDASAFEVLVGRWQAPLCRVLRRLVHDWNGSAPTDADDLAQDVFVRVYVARERYRPEAEFSTWLYRIAVNVCRDAARRQRRRPSMSLSGVEPVGRESNTSTATQVELAAQQAERCALVAEALTALDDKFREPLVLRHFGDLSFPQIADVLAEPCTTIKSRVQAGLKQLLAKLKQLGLDESEWES